MGAADTADSLEGKLLVLQTYRLGATPPALYSTQLLENAGVPLQVIEFGNAVESTPEPAGKPPRLRLQSPWTLSIPTKLRPLFVFVDSLLQLGQLFTRDGKPRVIVAHNLQAYAMAYCLRLFFGIPFCAHVHEANSTESSTGWNRFFFGFEKYALPKAEMVVFPEEGRANLYKERYGLRNPSFLVYNCPRLRKPQPSKLRERLKLPSSALLMGYIGGVDHPNAIVEAIEALAEVPTMHFALCGWSNPEYLETILATAKTFGVADRVHMLGQIDDKWDFLDGLDVSYCVYRPDTLRTKHLATASNKLTESLSSGLPVLTTTNPDFKSLVERLDVGQCASAITPSAIAVAMKNWVTSPETLRRQSENALNAHRTAFNFEHQFREFQKTFIKKYFSYFRERRKLSG